MKTEDFDEKPSLMDKLFGKKPAKEFCRKCGILVVKKKFLGSDWREKIEFKEFTLCSRCYNRNRTEQEFEAF